MYRFFYGHHSGGSSFVYVNDFCYYRNCLYTIGTSTALRKNRSIRVPVQYTVYSIDRYHAPDFDSDPPTGSYRDPTGMTSLP